MQKQPIIQRQIDPESGNIWIMETAARHEALCGEWVQKDAGQHIKNKNYKKEECWAKLII